MRILVTGSEGFIGSHLTRELRDHGHHVVGVDIKRDPLTQDVRDPKKIGAALIEHEPDVCVHLAARVGRLFGEDDLAETIADNAAMTAVVARACGDMGVRVVYASTSEVYGDNGDAVCDEHDGPFSLPHNLYGLSKLWGEQACRLYAPDRLTTLRFSMPYGPGLPAGVGRAAIVNMLWQALHGEPIPVHRGAERSWCWIGDTVAAARLAIEADGGVFNVGRDDDAVPMGVVADMACQLAGASLDLVRVVDPPARQTVVKRLATDRVRALGWWPRVELGEGMERTLEWVRTLGPDGAPSPERGTLTA